MCNCITEMNKQLADYNSRLEQPLTVNSTSHILESSRRVVISTEKIDSKKRGKVMRLFASYCPFCGLAYNSTGTEE